MPDPLIDDDIPEAVPVRKRRWLSMSHAIWLIPLVAVLVVGWLAVKEWTARGPTISIRFRSGEGIEAGKTRIKYRNVDVGQVTAVTLAPDLKGVIVTAEMGRDAAALLVEDTRLWVVRARVAGGEVSGLATLLSGAFIGIDGGKSKEERRDFVGLENQPVVAADESGREFTLKAASLGSLDIGSPLYFRGIRVGQILATEIDNDGSGLTLRVFVRAPFDRYINANTRFWHASGLDVSFDGNGVRFRTESLLTVLVGGVAFETPGEFGAGPPAAPNLSFTLFDSQPSAMRRAEWQVIDYSTVFADSVRGLAVGAPVEFKGFVIGEVAAVGISFDPDQGRVVFPVQLRIYRDIAANVVTPDASDVQPAGGRRLQVENLLSRRSIERGLRAQMRSANLLTGQRYIAIEFFPEERAAGLRGRQFGEREIPTMPDAFGELQASISRIVKRLEAVPFEEVAGDLRKALTGIERATNSVDATLTSVNQDVLPGARATLDETRAAIRDVRGLLAEDAPLPQDVRGAMQEVSRAADALRQLADSIERQPESLLRGRRAAPEPAVPAAPAPGTTAPGAAPGTSPQPAQSTTPAR